MLTAFVRDAVRRPRGLPDEGDFGAADGLEGGEAVLNLGDELSGGWCVGVLRRGEGERDVDAVAGRDSGDTGAGGFRVGRNGYGVDEAEVDDVAGEFGVVAVAEGFADSGFGEHVLLR